MRGMTPQPDGERLPPSRKRGEEGKLEWTDRDPVTEKSSIPHIISDPV
jgi:hypothetical protein